MGRNLIAGLANSILSALLGLMVVPFYLKYLGVEAYGLIGFFVTSQALMQLLDMGIAPTMNREVARCAALGNLKEAGKLLHTLAVVYWGIALAIALLIFAIAPFIANDWLQSKQIPVQTLTHAIMLMGLVIACRWSVALYQATLIGAARVTISSGINMVMLTMGSAGAILVLAFVSPTIEAFFIWQAGVGLVHALTIRAAAWRVIGKIKQNKFNLEQLKNIWRFSAGMTAIGLTSLVFTQMDKVILSKMLGLKEFGYYMLATLITSGLYVLVTPVFNIIYPRFSALVAEGKIEKLSAFYQTGTRLLVSVTFPIAMVLVVFGHELVLLWTGNLTTASNVAPIIAVLAIGSALHSAMFFPYALQLAYGMTHLPLTINIILMIVLVPLIIYFTLSYGAIGAAFAWLVLHIMYILIGTIITHRHLLKGIGIRWLFQDIGIPLVLTVSIGIFGYLTLHDSTSSVFVKILFAGVLIIVNVMLSVLTSKYLRSLLYESIRQGKKSVSSI